MLITDGLFHKGEVLLISVEPRERFGTVEAVVEYADEVGLTGEGEGIDLIIPGSGEVVLQVYIVRLTTGELRPLLVMPGEENNSIYFLHNIPCDVVVEVKR